MRVAVGVLTVAVWAAALAARPAWSFIEADFVDKLSNTPKDETPKPDDPVKLGLRAETTVGNGISLRTTVSVSSEETRQSLTGRVTPEIGISQSELALELKKDNRHSLQFSRSSQAGKEIRDTLTIGLGRLGLGFSQVTDKDGASVRKETMSYSGGKFQLKASTVDHDARFSGSTDLSKERGAKQTDVSATYRSGGLSLESTYFSSQNRQSRNQKDQLRSKLEYTGKEGVRLSFSHETSHTGAQTSARADQLHLESDKGKHLWGSFDLRNVDSGAGKFEKARFFAFGATPSKNISLSLGFRSVDRESGSENTRNLGLKWGIGKGLEFVAGMTDKSGGYSRREFGLSGKLADQFSILRNVRLSATHKSGDGLRGGLSMNLEAAISDFLLLRDGKIAFVRATEESGKESNRTRFESKLFGGSFTSELSSSLDERGVGPVSRGFSFTSDRSNKRFIYDLAIKSRDPGAGDTIGLRRWGASYRLSEKTTLAYSTFDHRERPDGSIERLSDRTINLSTAIKQFNLSLSYREDEDHLTLSTTTAYGLSLAGQLKSGAKIELAYSLDNALQDTGHILHFKYDHRISDTDFITFSTDLKTLGKNELRMRLDLKKEW